MHGSYKLVYHLTELKLIPPVATSSVERIFSAMFIIKIDLRSKMGDEWLNEGKNPMGDPYLGEVLL
jgi:hypothetical protein